MKRRLFYGLLVFILFLIAGYAWWNQKHPSADVMPGMSCSEEDKVIDLVTVQTNTVGESTATFYSRTGKAVLTETATLMQKTDGDAKLVKAASSNIFVPFGTYRFGSSWSNQANGSYPTNDLLKEDSGESGMMSGMMSPEYYVELTGNTINSLAVSGLAEVAGNKVVLAVTPNYYGGSNYSGMSCVANTGNLVDDLKGLDVTAAQVIVSDYIMTGQVQINGFAGLSASEQTQATNDTTVEVKRDDTILPVKLFKSSGDIRWVLTEPTLAGNYSVTAGTTLRQPNISDPLHVVRKSNGGENMRAWLDDSDLPTFDPTKIIGKAITSVLYPPGRDGTWSNYWGVWYPDGLYNGGLNVASGWDIAVSTGLVTGPVPSVWLGGVHYVDYYWFKLDIVDWYPRLIGFSFMGESTPECSSNNPPRSTYAVSLFQSDWSDADSGKGGFTSPPPTKTGYMGDNPDFTFEVNYCNDLRPIYVPVGTDKTLTKEQIKAYLTGSYSITKIGTNGHSYNDSISFRDVARNNVNVVNPVIITGDDPITGDNGSTVGNGGDGSTPVVNGGKTTSTDNTTNTNTGSSDTTGTTTAGGSETTSTDNNNTTTTTSAPTNNVPLTNSSSDWLTTKPYVEAVQRVADVIKDVFTPNRTVALPEPVVVEAPKVESVIKSPLEQLTDQVNALQSQVNDLQSQYNAADKKTKRTLVKNLNKQKSRLRVARRNLARAPKVWGQYEIATARYVALYEKATGLQAANPKAKTTRAAVRTAQAANRSMLRLQKTWYLLLKF